MAETIVVEGWISPLSPFAYLALPEARRVCAAAGARLRLRPFDVGRVFREHGTPPLPKRHPARIAYRAQDLPRLARRAGMPFNLEPAHWPTDASAACAALCAAEDHGGADIGAAASACCAAVWAEERDLADPAVWRAALAAGGIDADALDMDAGAARYAANTEDALARGVFGAPSWTVGDQLFWGGDRLPHLADHLAETAYA